ncbi:MAG: hypothetical protein JST85_27010 [Acidobacteria bacterium]|nr:hypothetical protein [Acidobacteriota bacterium]
MKFSRKGHLFGFGRKQNNHTLLKVLGGSALALVGAGLLANLADLKRYIRISTM